MKKCKGDCKPNSQCKCIDRAFVLSLVLVLLGALLLFTIDTKGGTRLTAYGSSFFTNAAAKYKESRETVTAPIIINHRGNDYYYVPIEVSGNVSGTFPGVMLDKNASPVINKNILMELYRYPAVLTETSDTRTDFDSLADVKAKAIAQYCNIINNEQNQLGKMVASGEIGVLLYHGAKLAFGAVGLVHNAVEGLGALAADLAKGEVQNVIIGLFIPRDSREALDAARGAYTASRQSTGHCLRALQAWQSLKTTSGTISSEKAKNATEALYLMYGSEANSFKSLRGALQKINKCPRVISKISEKDYKKGMAGFDNLISQLDSERSYWKQENDDANTFLDTWAQEQIRRVKAATPSRTR